VSGCQRARLHVIPELVEALVGPKFALKRVSGAACSFPRPVIGAHKLIRTGQGARSTLKGLWGSSSSVAAVPASQIRAPAALDGHPRWRTRSPSSVTRARYTAQIACRIDVHVTTDACKGLESVLVPYIHGLDIKEVVIWLVSSVQSHPHPPPFSTENTHKDLFKVSVDSLLLINHSYIVPSTCPPHALPPRAR